MSFIVVLLRYTKRTMKSSALVKLNTKSKSKNTRVSLADVKKSQKKLVRPSALSRTIRVTKRYGKQTLRAMLLSHMFHTTFKVFVGLVISYAALHGAYIYIGKSFADDIVVSQSEIIARVAKLTEVPLGAPEDIVRVQNPDDLRKQNSFYQDVKEGDYIVMYPKLAVIYDLRNNSIVAVRKTER